MFIGRNDDSDDSENSRSPAYYWWFLANLLAISFAILSWIFCLHIFGHPELPRNYAILKKLDRLPELEQFTARESPKSLSLDPGELYGKYFGIGEEKRQKLNALLIRNFVNNFSETSLLTYVEGNFEILAKRPLTNKDFFHSGFALKTQAMVSPDDFTVSVPFPVVVEYLFPTEDESAAENLAIGDNFQVQRRPHCIAVLNVSLTVANDEPALQLTVVPIASGQIRLTEEVLIRKKNPEFISPGAEFPLWK